ncbi:hypothetical protein CQW23_31628 [Capsicum baccatum]|uniref:Uncharacterized protein n=1 Tax=Capsicum baccatum TaxID=33114 RepID=A0A2G2V725_CAPBA|nr:hypothetical protein CQW23_31628 [Capsicum baccatum]
MGHILISFLISSVLLHNNTTSNSWASHYRISNVPSLTLLGHSISMLDSSSKERSINEPPVALSTIGFITKLKALYKVSIKCGSIILWFGHCASFFLNLSQVSCSASVGSYLKLQILSLSYTLMEGGKNHSRNVSFNYLQLIVELGSNSFNYIVASPNRDKANKLNLIAFWLTLELSKDFQMVMKFTKYILGSSPGKPLNNPFRFWSWIMVLIMLNFAPSANGGGMIAPIAPSLSIPSSSSSALYSIGGCTYLSRTGRFLMTFRCNGSGDVIADPNFSHSPEPWPWKLGFLLPIVQPFFLSVRFRIDCLYHRSWKASPGKLHRYCQASPGYSGGISMCLPATLNNWTDLKALYTSGESSMTIDKIVDIVLGTKSGYIKGIGYGPKPNTIRAPQKGTAKLEDSIKKAKQEAASSQNKLQK